MNPYQRLAARIEGIDVEDDDQPILSNPYEGLDLQHLKLRNPPVCIKEPPNRAFLIAMGDNRPR